MSRFAYVPVPEGFDGLSRVAKAVWFGLCTFASWEGDQGSCWPSQAKLGRRIGFSRNAVHQGLEELRALGVVLWERSRDGRSLVYRLEAGCTATEQGCTATEQGCTAIVQGGVTPVCTNNTNITIPENSLTPEAAGAMFEALWEQYRRYNPGGRAEARREFLGLFPAGMPRDEARRREGLVLEGLNEAAGAWEVNLERGEARFNPRMGLWLRRQFGGSMEAAS